jgi:hypothetical protein
MLLERLGDKELFAKIISHNGFVRYINNIGFKIDESDLICITMSYVQYICSQL